MGSLYRENEVSPLISGYQMKPKDTEFCLPQSHLWLPQFKDFLDSKNPWFILEKKMNWSLISEDFGDVYAEKGRPGIPTRVMVTLHLIKYSENLSDEEVVKKFTENVYYQYFCGYQYMQHESPCDATTMGRWRRRVGEEKLGKLHQRILSTAVETQALKVEDLQDLNIDTTVQEKNITFPTDAKLLHKARELLVKTAEKEHGLKIKKNWKKSSKKSLIQASRYAHAKQFKRMKKEVKKLKTYLSRVQSLIVKNIAEPNHRLKNLLEKAERLKHQKKHDKNKLYSLHEPHVKCISKGKAHKRYEFGNKVSLVTTNKSNWIVGITSFLENKYDGHTYEEALQQAQKIIGAFPSFVFADQGYKGLKNKSTPEKLYLTAQKRLSSPAIKKKLKRRSAIEPVIGHTKKRNRLGRNFLKGVHGDVHNALLAGIGRNFCKLLAFFYFSFFTDVFLPFFA